METTETNEVEPEDNLSADELRKLLAGLPGVADIEVDLREDGSPRIRVMLDGSVDVDAVGSAVREALQAASVHPTEPRRQRRAGLGRGLDEILAAERTVEPPPQFQPDEAEPDAEGAPSLALIAVEETVGGISVRAADSQGGIAFSPVEDPRSLNQAVVSAVARLRQEKPAPRLAGVEIRDVSGAPVLTVVLLFADGRRAVGAALVEGGMPFTLGRAVWEAIGSSD